MVAMATLSGLGATSPRLNPRATGSTVSGGLNIESGPACGDRQNDRILAGSERFV